MTEADSSLEKVFAYIDSQKEYYVKDLAEIVGIESVSTEPGYLQQLIQALDWAENRLNTLGVQCNRVETCQSSAGDACSTPPIIFGTYGRKVDKSTLLVYNHVDVVRAKASDWDTPPFQLQEKDGILKGRGACTKAPLLCWIHAIEAFHATQLEVPVNVKFLVEALKERGSEELNELATDRQRAYFDDVSFICIPAGVWLDNSKPCLNYSLRGFLHFKLQVDGPKQDLHSGYYGGMVQEPLGDLVFLLSSLQDGMGRIQIPGLRDDDVLPSTDDEIRSYRALEVDMEDIRQATGAPALAHKGDKARVLLHTTRIPSLSIHGIEGAYSGPGHKTVIPAKVVGRFSVSLVPNQTVEKTRALVQDYIQKLWASRRSPNRLQFDVVCAGEPWSCNPADPHFQAASRSIEKVFGVAPQVAPSAYSVPLMAHLPPGSNSVIIPVARPADRLNAPNEGISMHNYVEYVKVFSAYILEVAQLRPRI